ncbi:MAG: CapA family protein [Chloroflexi bacterium]|nr:CapA family protein [Chloroflexota bacterium]
MLYEAQAGNLTLAAGGDTMITRRMSVFNEDGFVRLRKLFQEADVGFTNLEMLMHDFEHSPGMAGGTFTGSDPKNLRELEWMGVNLVSCANNHSYDYGEGGLLTNLEHLRHSDLVHAGTGRNLSEARAPAYLDTPNGRVALISASSTFSEAGRALEQRPDIRGRPGLNPLRFNTTHVIDRPAFDALRRVNKELGLEAQRNALRNFKHPGAIAEDSDSRFVFLDKVFALGEEFSVSTQLDRRDLNDNLKWVRDARRMADWVMVSVHCHESGANRDEPPQFLVDFARACIDEGADVFIGHGPHITRGLEIYKDRPIFYSLGNFIFQNDTVRWQPSYNYDTVKLDAGATPADFYDARTDHDKRGFPADALYWESVVAHCDFKRESLNGITLHPIDLGHAQKRSQRGRPLLATSDVSRRALERMKRLSKPLGTDIRIERGVGKVRL